MRFEFATATEILVGRGTHDELAARVARLGTRIFTVTGRSTARVAPVLASLHEGVVGSFAVGHEPTIDDARRGAAAVRSAGADVVLAVGGGSVMDLGKAIAALATNDGDPLDYVEVIGRGQALGRQPLPCVAVPTTAGTGAEVTRNAVLAAPAHGLKVSIRSPLMLPRLAIVDPELTLGLSPALTAATGMDALTQLLEPFVSVRATPLVDAICIDGLPRAGRALRRAYANGADISAREDMALASLFGGLALANAGLGAVHGIAAAVGGRFAAPHGAVCAGLLPGTVAANIAALRQRDPGGPGLARYGTVTRLLTGDGSIDSLAAWLETLRRDLAIPALGAYGLTAQDVESVAAAAVRASSTRGNPIVLSEEEVRDVIERAL